MFPVWMVYLIRRWKCQNLTTLIFRRPCHVKYATILPISSF
ncbi:hypothetical protein NEISUBOT_03450 [Neisseria subflava NJ9703]|uniref:Uncharacterized protein n=1 Tax=Neisseria subflava NJ9703 TaxID=546268 RepID=A0A9W5ITC8_NEISU|nr:hypothetical protein NEISUBOT_03450 [Neisseria subflava NJ9703]